MHKTKVMVMSIIDTSKHDYW